MLWITGRQNMKAEHIYCERTCTITNIISVWYTRVNMCFCFTFCNGGEMLTKEHALSNILTQSVLIPVLMTVSGRFRFMGRFQRWCFKSIKIYTDSDLGYAAAWIHFLVSPLRLCKLPVCSSQLKFCQIFLETKSQKLVRSGLDAIFNSI